MQYRNALHRSYLHSPRHHVYLVLVPLAALYLSTGFTARASAKPTPPHKFLHPAVPDFNPRTPTPNPISISPSRPSSTRRPNQSRSNLMNFPARKGTVSSTEAVHSLTVRCAVEKSASAVVSQPATSTRFPIAPLAAARRHPPQSPAAAPPPRKSSPLAPAYPAES
jgi:hypothetical protein